MWSFQNEILTKQKELGFGSDPYEETVGFPAGNAHEAIHCEFLECLMRNPDGMCMLAAMRHVPFKGQFAKSVKEIVQEIVPQEEEEQEEEELEMIASFTQEEGFTTFQDVLAELKKIMESPPLPEEFLDAARERDEHEKKVKEFKEQEQKAKEEQKPKEQEQNKKRARTD